VAKVYNLKKGMCFLQHSQQCVWPESALNTGKETINNHNWVCLPFCGGAVFVSAVFL